MRLRQAARLVRGAGFPHDHQGLETGDLPFFKVGDLSRLSLDVRLMECDNWIDRATAEQLRARTVPADSVLLPKIGAAMLLRTRRITSHESVFDNNILGVVPLALESRYLRYWLETIDLTELANPGPIPSLDDEAFLNLRVPVSGAVRQGRIADFLDAETARIDALIEKKRRMIELLEQRKSLLFVRALETRRFRWGATLESPAADGDLPTRWKVAHLSTVLEQLTNGYVGPTRDVLVESGVKYIQSLHIKDGEIDFARGPYYVPPEWHDARPRIHLRSGDVLIVQTGDIGQVAVVPAEFGPASCHALQIARVRKDLLTGEYLGAYLRSPFGRQSLLSRVTGALHPHLEGGIRDIPVAVPPLSIQSEVVDELRGRASLIDRLRMTLDRQIDLLRERRQALITAAVTGELVVATAGR